MKQGAPAISSSGKNVSVSLGTAENDIGYQAPSTFYRNVDVTKLEEEDFEAFWDALAEKNRDAYAVGAPAPAAPAAAANAVQTAAAASAAPEEEPPEDPEAAFKAACDTIKKAISTRPLRKEVYRRTLEACRTRREYSAVEAEIQAMPQYEHCEQSPYRFITVLIEAGGLAQLSLDAEGNPLPPEAFEGLTEDEADDLVDVYALETTEAGKAVADELSPKLELKKLLARFADRAGVYQDLLGFIKSNHCNYKQIEELFKGRDFSALATIGRESNVALKPSVFVDNLEKAGGIVWKDGGWTITAEGEAFLQTLLEKSAV